MLTIALPGGKSLENETRKVFSEAGIRMKENGGRCHDVAFPDLPVLSRGVWGKPSRIPIMVASGICDVGITGSDTIDESGATVVCVATLPFGRASIGKTQIVLFADDPDTEAEHDLRSGKNAEILSEYPNMTRTWLAATGLSADVVPSPGGVEAEIPHLFRYGVCLTETGASLRDNGLRVIAVLAESQTVLVANPDALAGARRTEIEDLRDLLLGTLRARDKILLVMNAPGENAEGIAKILPALGKPTVAHLFGGKGISISAVMTHEEANKLIPLLKRLGATGILKQPLLSVIPD